MFSFLLSAHFANAQMTRGAASYASESQCASSGKIPAEICANAQTNAAAEFDEKAPRFPSRAVCERIYGSCSLGFRGADGWAGRRSGIYFTPRRQGFRVTVKSEHEATVVPIAPGLSFAVRSAMRRDASINPKARREYAGAVHGYSGHEDAAFGVATPEGAKEAPPPPPVDPNFDCAAVLEPSDKGDPDTGCYLAPSRRR